MLTKLSRRERRGLPRENVRHGQSFVELALVLPVLLIIIAGSVEVGNILTVYNRVQLAAREGARFGAAGGSNIGQIIEQTSSESLAWDANVLTVWTIRPSIDLSTTPSQWQNATVDMPWGVQEYCIFGDRCADTSFSNPVTPDEVLNDVDEIDIPAGIDLTNVTFVVVVVRYEVDTILNLEYFQPGDAVRDGRTPVWSYSIMVQEIDEETVNRLSGGCSSYPIALNSLLIPDDIQEGDLILNVARDIDPTLGGTTGGFSYLEWRETAYGIGQLTAPPCGSPSGSEGSLCSSTVSLRSDVGYLEFGSNPPDTTLHRGDWVLAFLLPEDAFATSPIVSKMQDHMNAERALRIIVYAHVPGGGPGANPEYRDPGRWLYRIDGFAIVKVAAVTINQVTFEWVRWDSSCGYDLDE
jgi:hypothetical protein